MTDVGLGYELIVQDQYVSGASTITVDVSIPDGKVVISSGISTDGFGNAYMSADGPHPTDSTKWRFMASTAMQSGGGGYSMEIHCWMIVVNAAS
jgi:hypothetical protein